MVTLGVRVLEALADYKHPLGLRCGCAGKQAARCLDYARRLFISCFFLPRPERVQAAGPCLLGPRACTDDQDFSMLGASKIWGG